MVQSNSLQAGLLRRPNSSRDMGEHMACVRQKWPLFHAQAQSCRELLWGFTSDLIFPVLAFFGQLEIYSSIHSEYCGSCGWSVKHGRVKEDTARKITVSCASYLTLVHICSSFSVLGELYLSFVSKASLRIRLCLPWRTGQRKIPVK